MNETVTLIFSSGVVSFIVTIMIIALSLGKYKEKIDRHDKELDKLNDKLNDKINEIIQRLAIIEGGLERDRANIYIKSKSPLSLTEKGKALLLDSNGKDYIDSKKSEFIEELKLKKPKTAYDVQELSRKIIEQRTSNDEFNQIKEYAFKQGLKLDIIVDVLAIYLRDLMLLELGFKIEDIK